MNLILALHGGRVASRPFRIPLAGPYTTRVSAVNAADSSSGYVGTGIVGLMTVGKASQSTDKDARYINCFPQTISDPITGKKRVFAVKRPGFTTSNTPASGEKGYAIMVWTGNSGGTDVISAFGATNSTIYNSTTSLGAITGRATGITETSINGTATLTVSSSDNTGWYYDTGAGVMTEITDAQWPGDSETIVGTFAHLDGFACIMTSRGRLWASDLNSVTAWTANSFGTTNAYPDKGVGCVRQGNFIMAFGTESVEFWYNAGLSPFPLARANAKTVKVGAVSADAIAQIADTVWWCGSTPQGGLSIFQYDSALTRVSTPEIDSLLILAGASNITLTTIRFYGRSFVLAKAGTATLVYCVEEKLWHEWNSTTPLWYKCAGVSLGGTMLNYAVSNVTTSGKVYLMNQASLAFTDDGTTYSARVQLPPQDFGTNKVKTYSDLAIIADQETSSSSLTISYTDDDYQSYTTHASVDLMDARPYTTRLGASRKRGWVLTHSANTPMRLEAMEGNVEVGS